MEGGLPSILLPRLVYDLQRLWWNQCRSDVPTDEPRKGRVSTGIEPGGSASAQQGFVSDRRGITLSADLDYTVSKRGITPAQHFSLLRLQQLVGGEKGLDL